MATTIDELKTLLKDKMEGLAVFGEVFPYGQGDFSKYPVCVITPVGGKGNTIDTNRVERTFQFLIKLYQEQSIAGKTKQEADAIMTQISDAILTSFDQDPDLAGEVEIVRVVEFELDFKVAAGTFNFATFRVDCVVIVPNY
jgi:hypothetical protein